MELGWYHHDDGGNPLLDERLTVIEPILLWDSNVSEGFGYPVAISYYNVSESSISAQSSPARMRG